MDIEILVEGIGHAEGPVVLPDGRCTFCEGYEGRLGVWSPSGGRGVYAKLGGAPNGAVLGADGCVYVANNGGAIGPYRSSDFGPGSIQKVWPNGTVETVVSSVAGHPLNMPNDLVFAADGRLYFTDPGIWDAEARPDDGYVYAVSPDGAVEVIASVGKAYPNGIAAEPDGSMVWVESYTRRVRRWHPNGDIEEVHQFADERHVPDGLAIAENGDLYIATLSSGGFHILSPDGSRVELVDLGGTTLSNCVFEGGDLFLTDLGSQAGVTQEAVFFGRLLRCRPGVTGMAMFRGVIGA
ncbi:MAG TPA: SMP-30/gluconolactonase/LRE family protein [Acidimicrobiales bacterium]|nr:SMP-30/gluconolactonase/LRE family protein [Acidimicrobiales bacterium]